MIAASHIDAKLLANIKARAALVGVAVSRIADDRGRQVFVVTRVDWALTRQLDNLDELEQFLERARGLALVGTRRELPP